MGHGVAERVSFGAQKTCGFKGIRRVYRLRPEADHIVFLAAEYFLYIHGVPAKRPSVRFSHISGKGQARQALSGILRAFFTPGIGKRKGPLRPEPGQGIADLFCEQISSLSKEAFAPLDMACQAVHLTGKVNCPSLRLADGLAPQDHGKRFNQLFPNISEQSAEKVCRPGPKLCVRLCQKAQPAPFFLLSEQAAYGQGLAPPHWPATCGSRGSVASCPACAPFWSSRADDAGMSARLSVRLDAEGAG